MSPLQGSKDVRAYIVDRAKKFKLNFLWLHELTDPNLKRQRNREPRVSIRQAIQCSWATTKLKRTAETCWMPFDPWVEMNVGLGGTGIQKSYAMIVQASSAHKKVGEVDHMSVERSAADSL